LVSVKNYILAGLVSTEILYTSTCALRWKRISGKPRLSGHKRERRHQWHLALRSRRDRAGRPERPGEPPDLRRGLRWVDGPDLPGRPVLRSDAGDLAGAHAVDGGAGGAQAEGAAAVGAAAVPGVVRGGVAGGVWRQWKHRNSQSYLYKYSLSNPDSY
jgi:hypothetical protein